MEGSKKKQKNAGRGKIGAAAPAATSGSQVGYMNGIKATESERHSTFHSHSSKMRKPAA